MNFYTIIITIRNICDDKTYGDSASLLVCLYVLCSKIIHEEPTARYLGGEKAVYLESLKKFDKNVDFGTRFL